MSTPWKALLWKEWRESRMVVGLTGVAILLEAAWELSPLSSGNQGRNGFHDVMAWGFPLLTVVSGFVLGLMQVLRDIRADAWGLCIHRAVTRSSCFSAKLLVGGGSLLAVWTLTTLLIALWCIWPGIPFVPFLPEFLLLSVEAQAVGLAAYAAGVAMAAGNGRWWASRWFPLLPAALLVMGLHNVPLWVELVLCAVCIPVTLLGGRAFWLSGPGGVVRRGAWLTTGPTWVVAVVLLGLLGALLESSSRSSRSGEWSGSWKIDEQGRPLLSYRHQFEDQLVDEHGERQAADKVVFAPEGYLSNWGSFQTHPLHLWAEGRSYRHLVETSNNAWDPPPWVRVALPTRAEVRIYDQRSGRQAMWQTADGPVQVLPGRMWGDLVVGPTTIWSMFEMQRLAMPVFRADAGEEIRFVSNIRSRVDNSTVSVEATYVIQTDRRVAVLRQGRPVQSLPRWDTWGDIHLLPDGRVVTLCERSTSTIMTTYDAEGRLVSERPLVRPPNLPPEPAPRAMPAVAGLIPLPALLCERLLGHGHDDQPFPWSALITSLVLHLLAIAIVICWSRRHQVAAASTWRWSLLAALTGPQSVLVFFVHARLPRLVRCPVCGRKRSLAAESCGACGAPWPAAPPLDAQGISA